MTGRVDHRLLGVEAEWASAADGPVGCAGGDNRNLNVVEIADGHERRMGARSRRVGQR